MDNRGELINEHTHLKHSYIDCELCSDIMSRVNSRAFNDAISKVKTAEHACMCAALPCLRSPSEKKVKQSERQKKVRRKGNWFCG